MPTASPSRPALCVHFMATPWSSGPTPIGPKVPWAASQPGGPCLDSIQGPPGDSPAAMVDWRIVIVSADVVGVPRVVADEVAARVEKQHGLKRPQLLINASHTHTGPGDRKSTRL